MNGKHFGEPGGGLASEGELGSFGHGVGWVALRELVLWLAEAGRGQLGKIAKN